MGDALDDGFEAYDLEVDTEEFADDDEVRHGTRTERGRASNDDGGHSRVRSSPHPPAHLPHTPRTHAQPTHSP